MRLLRVFRRVLAIIGLIAIIAAGGLAWLYANPPQPRTSKAWVLGPPLPARRRELTTAVAYAQPCPAPPCREAERLFVVGGLSGLFRPEASVAIYDPMRKHWNDGPPLPSPRHHLAAVALEGTLYVSGGTTV